MIPFNLSQCDDVIDPLIKMIFSDLFLGEIFSLTVIFTEQPPVEVIIVNKPPPPDFFPVWNPDFENTPFFLVRLKTIACLVRFERTSSGLEADLLPLDDRHK